MKFKIIALSVLSALVTLPAFALDSFKIDPAHTSVSFYVRHLGINDVIGRFKDFNGTVTVDGGAVTAIEGSIQVASIDTEVDKRDGHLRTADFFDVAKFPSIAFKSTSVEKKEGGFLLTGDLTMHGVTKEIKLPVTLSGPITDTQGKTRLGLQSKASLNRKDFGIPYDEKLPDGTSAVGDHVELQINAEAIK